MKKNQRKGDPIPAFGEAVRVARQAAGLTLKCLADQVGSGASAISDIEQARRAPSLGMAAKIALALKIKSKLADFARPEEIGKKDE